MREGETIEVAVDTRALHFFDVETGLGIYDGEAARTRSVPEQPRHGRRLTKEADDYETDRQT